MATDAHVHRFRDRVGLSLPGKGETVYLTPAEARDIATALISGAGDIDRVAFVDSDFVPVIVPLSRPGLHDKRKEG
jgi:hypothetical protein